MSCNGHSFFGSIINAAVDECERQIQRVFGERLRGTGFSICNHQFGSWSAPRARLVKEHNLCTDEVRVVGHEQVSTRECSACGHHEYHIQALPTPKSVVVPWYDRNRVALMDALRQPLTSASK